MEGVRFKNWRFAGFYLLLKNDEFNKIQLKIVLEIFAYLSNSKFLCSKVSQLPTQHNSLVCEAKRHNA
jgi:hypothetical protein